MIVIKSSALNEIGGRKNNEDAIFPIKGKAKVIDRLFLVCDGVGGHEKGEVASALICEEFPAYFDAFPPEPNDPNYLEQGLIHVEKALSNHTKYTNTESSGMASTLTLLYLSESLDAALVGWVGDSRIYHIRDGEIIFKSKDHSEVQSLIDMGEITEEEAKTHPRKNVITRAVSDSKATRIDQLLLTDLRKDDYFLLCSDGLLETFSEEAIPDLFLAKNTTEQIKENLFWGAQGNTKDNFSMYLIKIGDVSNNESNADLTLNMRDIYSSLAALVKRLLKSIGLRKNK